MSPIDPAALVPYLVAVAMMELTPGPNMGWLAVLSAHQGRRAGWAAVAGVTLGLAAYLLAAVIGLAEVIVRARPVYEALRWAGVLYLLWLAWDTWRAGNQPIGDVVAPEAGLWAPFRRGLVANLLNPKAAVFYLTVLPAFIDPDRAPPVVQISLLGAAHLLVALSVHAAIVTGAAGAHGVIGRGPPERQRRLALIFALSIAAIAVWLAISTRWQGGPL